LALLLFVDVSPSSESRRWPNQDGCVGSHLGRGHAYPHKHATAPRVIVPNFVALGQTVWAQL